MASKADSSKVRKKFILDHLPYEVFHNLCQVLDGANTWEMLGGKYMKFNLLRLDEFRRSESGPSKAMLTYWGYTKGSIDRLFIYLMKMEHYRAVNIILPYVSPERQKLFLDRQDCSTYLMGYENDNSTSFSTGYSLNIKDTSDFNGPQKNYSMFKSTVMAQKNIRDSTLEKEPVFRNQSRNIKIPEEGGVSDLNKLRSPGDRLSESRVYDPKLESFQSRISKIECLQINEHIKEETDLKNVCAKKDKELIREEEMGKNQSYDQSRKKLSDASIQSNSSLPHISFAEVKLSTNHLNSNNILGQGGFGVVYSGVWKNTPVAIKYIEKKKNPCISNDDAKLQQSLTEIWALDCFRHKNIVSLYGYSLDEQGLCLIYQLMHNGSLEDRLRCRKGSKPLTWMQRLSIVLGTACGIQYLHTVRSDRPFIHGDIKSANILLDKNFEPKLGDFGLMHEGPPSEKTHMYVKYINGTRAYLPIEYLQRNVLSTKVDTYGFGMVLFEVATALPAFDDRRGKEKKSLALFVRYYQPSKWMEICDERGGKEQNHLFHHFVLIGRACTEDNKNKRPEMDVVFKELESLTDAEEAKIKEAELLKDSIDAPLYNYKNSTVKESYEMASSVKSVAEKVTKRVQSTSPSNGASSTKLISENVESTSNNNTVENYLPHFSALGLGL